MKRTICKNLIIDLFIVLDIQETNGFQTTKYEIFKNFLFWPESQHEI